MLDAQDPIDLPPLFFEAAAKQKGQSLARHHNDPYFIQEVGGGDQKPKAFFYPIEVEPGAQELVLLVSTRRSEASQPWSPTISFHTPASGVATPTSMVVDQYFYLARFSNPEPGTWSARIPKQTLTEAPATVSAFVDRPGVRCGATMDRRVIGANEPITIIGTASDGLPLVEGVAFTARISRPDDSELSVPLVYSSETGDYRALLLPADLRGKGEYQVVAQCEVAPGAKAPPGESTFTDVPPNDHTSVGFVRSGSTSFSVRIPELPPFVTEPNSPFLGDSDGDGIDDGSEDPADHDGDGLPGPLDGDNDGDDTPDGMDPDPSDPNIPVITQLFPNAGADQVVECAANGSAQVTLDGSASEGLGGILTFAWSSPVTLTGANTATPSGLFPVGTTAATLTISENGATDQDTTLVTVIDTTGPSITVPPDVYAQACGAINIGSATAEDSCGGSVTVTSNKPNTFKAGINIVTWTAVDQYGNPASKQQRVIVAPGENTSCCPAGSNVIIGTPNNDFINGTAGVDCIFGKGSQDTIKSFGGADIISGGDGNDTIEGGDLGDIIQGGTGQDTLRGQGGADIIFGNDGDDQCWGGSEDDVMYGGQGQDKLYGEANNDSLFGEGNDDRLEGSSGDDVLNGGTFNDTCLPGTGANTLLSCEVIQ